MTELLFNTVFKEVSCMFKGEAFSTMYFGRHFDKNLLILQHEITVMTVFGDEPHRTSPEFVKTVSFRGDRRKGVQIVGNENVVLLLDDDGGLWRLINAFGEKESFHCLKGDCFYEWIPFKKFNFVKVLALSAMQSGFACLGLCGDFKRKLAVMPSFESPLEDYTFDELHTSESVSYYLTNFKVNIKNSNTDETLLVTDRGNSKTFLCAKNGRNALVNVSNNYLISALHLQQENCLLLCFENGKLVFCFYNESQKHSVAYLSKKITFIKKWYTPNCCLLWSDGCCLNYTKLTFQPGEDVVKLSQLKLNCNIQNPVSVVKINHDFLVVTMNNVYYYITAGVRDAKEITKGTQELLTEICNGSSLCEKLEEKADLLAHYLRCKDIVQKHKGEVEIKWEGNSLMIKNCLEVTLKERFWKVQLSTAEGQKKSVHVVDLETDLNKDGLIIIENPFKNRCSVGVSLVGNFDGRELFLDLGEVGQLEGCLGIDEMRKQFDNILKKKNHISKFY